MELSPKTIASMSFPIVKRGFDQDHVRAWLAKLARGVEELHNRALQAEARARMAEAAAPGDAAAPAAAPGGAGAAGAAAGSGAPDAASMESITKTLLIAQRTADAAVAEARDEAEGIR